MTEYVLFHNEDRHNNPSYWYGFYNSATEESFWSKWCDSIPSALTAPLIPDTDYEPLDAFILENPDQHLLYRSTTPLNLDNHPELLI